ADDGMELEDMVLADEQKRMVHAAVKKLPEDMRVVIHLVYFEEMTYEEAAKIMKKNRKQIDNLLYRAKKDLRIILGKDGELLL
ncbi:MAG: sigma-70 family RNA polymerase sigma factor, partial [Oscillospiraceae bacterium]|nr:sigma-70 family RNA polymerase sigma factor [Oscillospiraceae bacterium]